MKGLNRKRLQRMLDDMIDIYYDYYLDSNNIIHAIPRRCFLVGFSSTDGWPITKYVNTLGERAMGMYIVRERKLSDNAKKIIELEAKIKQLREK